MSCTLYQPTAGAVPIPPCNHCGIRHVPATVCPQPLYVYTLRYPSTSGANR